MNNPTFQIKALIVSADFRLCNFGTTARRKATFLILKRRRARAIIHHRRNLVESFALFRADVVFDVHQRFAARRCRDARPESENRGFSQFAFLNRHLQQFFVYQLQRVVKEFRSTLENTGGASENTGEQTQPPEPGHQKTRCRAVRVTQSRAQMRQARARGINLKPIDP